MASMSKKSRSLHFGFRHFFIEVYRSSIPSHITDRLSRCLPSSLPLLRRLQFANNFEGIGQKMEWNRILIYAGPRPSTHLDGHFAAAYFEPSCKRECWIYSSLEQHVPFISKFDQDTLPHLRATQKAALSRNDLADAEDILLTVLRRMRDVEADYSAYYAKKGVENPNHEPGWVHIGYMNETVRRVLIERGVGVEPSAEVPKFSNYIFRTEICRDWDENADMLLPKEWRWDVVRPEDLQFLKDTTEVNQDKLLMVPSMVIRSTHDGELIAWGFLDEDGSVTMDVGMPDHWKNIGRNRLTTALVRRLIRFHQENFGHDGWCHTLIAFDEIYGETIKNLDAMAAWPVSWAKLNLSTVGDPIKTDNFLGYYSSDM